MKLIKVWGLVWSCSKQPCTVHITVKLIRNIVLFSQLWDRSSHRCPKDMIDQSFQFLLWQNWCSNIKRCCHKLLVDFSWQEKVVRGLNTLALLSSSDFWVDFRHLPSFKGNIALSKRFSYFGVLLKCCILGGCLNK